MRIRIDVFHHHGIEGREFAELKTGLTRILREILSMEDRMTKEFDDLATKITALETAVNSLIDLTTQLAADVAANKEDPAKIQEISDGVQAEIDKVKATLEADTPPASPAV